MQLEVRVLQAEEMWHSRVQVSTQQKSLDKQYEVQAVHASNRHALRGDTTV